MTIVPTGDSGFYSICTVQIWFVEYVVNYNFVKIRVINLARLLEGILRFPIDQQCILVSFQAPFRPSV